MKAGLQGYSRNFSPCNKLFKDQDSTPRVWQSKSYLRSSLNVEGLDEGIGFPLWIKYLQAEIFVLLLMINSRFHGIKCLRQGEGLKRIFKEFHFLLQCVVFYLLVSTTRRLTESLINHNFISPYIPRPSKLQVHHSQTLTAPTMKTTITSVFTHT